MLELIHQHPGIAGIAAFWFFSAFVGGMPAPTSTSSSGYVWMHNSLHLLAGNIQAAIVTRYPQALPSGSIQVTTSQEKTITKVPVADEAKP